MCFAIGFEIKTMSALQGCVPCAIEKNDIVEVESASVSDAETVQNTNTHYSSVAEEPNESELLKGLLTDTFCQVCEAVLLFESQRVSHYEGKKHAQRVRIYLQTKKTERNKKNQECCNFLSGNTDPEKFCELCNMVFSSPIVARSHYEGKVHAKNIKKSHANPSVVEIGLVHPCIKCICVTEVKPPGGPMATPREPIVEGIAQAGADQELKESVASAAQSVELSDHDKYCKLCAASFNNPMMAQQHYSGRKHLRNQSRQELLSQIGEESEHVNSLTCPVCCVTLSSLETYQAHMQGNKHHIQEKKIHSLCQSQKKVYDSFQDELDDYIQVQRARGLDPKKLQGLEALAQKKADEEEKAGAQFEKDPQFPSLPLHPPPPPPPPLPSLPPVYHPHNWHPQFQPPASASAFGFRGRPPVPHWGKGYPPHPPPLMPGLKGRLQHRGQSPNSSSSSVSDSSTYSSSNTSSSSSESSSDHSRDRRRQIRKRKERARRKTTDQANNPKKDAERRRSKKKWKEGEEEQGHAKKAKGDREGDGLDKDKARRKLKKRSREMDSTEEEEHRSKTRENKKRPKEGHQGKRQREETEGEWNKVSHEDVLERIGAQLQSETTETKTEEHHDERTDIKEDRTKRKKEKRKTKRLDCTDNRTEEEKLWDATILGVF